MILQPIRRTARYIATSSGKLLPYLFTITTYRGKLCTLKAKRLCGCYSLLRYSSLTTCYPLGSMALCVARTFLTASKVLRDRLSSSLYLTTRNIIKSKLTLALWFYLTISTLVVGSREALRLSTASTTF